MSRRVEMKLDINDLPPKKVKKIDVNENTKKKRIQNAVALLANLSFT